jgi:hypothetical protein
MAVSGTPAGNRTSQARPKWQDAIICDDGCVAVHDAQSESALSALNVTMNAILVQLQLVNARLNAGVKTQTVLSVPVTVSL